VLDKEPKFRQAGMAAVADPENKIMSSQGISREIDTKSVLVLF
jgi:hypothetical protein